MVLIVMVFKTVGLGRNSKEDLEWKGTMKSGVFKWATIGWSHSWNYDDDLDTKIITRLTS